MDREPKDSLGVFVGLRNVLLLYVAIAIAWLVASYVIGQERRVTTMSHGIQYEHPDRRSPAGSNDYFGATSRGVDKNVYWEIRWSGPYNSGPTAIDAVRATLDHLTHLQKTTAASESNAKLINHLVQATEEFDGVKPTMGGELNNLIPKLED